MKNTIASAWALVAAFTAVAGCGGDAAVSPFAQQQSGSDGGANNDADTQSPPPAQVDGSASHSSPDASVATDATPGPSTGIGCGTTPTRYVVLGHSVAHCFAVGGPTSEACAFKNVQTYLATKFPGLTYENYAQDGALIADVVSTGLPQVAGGPGNIFVNLYIGGNDLAAHLYEADAQAQQSWINLKPQAMKDLETILSYFDDQTKFPGKATIVVNSQYNPFDECVAGQYSFVTLAKQKIILEFNDVLVSVASAHKNAVVVDQYPGFLGHGHNYNQSQCPKYAPGMDDWMADLIHPNEKGHVSLTKQLTAAVDTLYKCP